MTGGWFYHVGIAQVEKRVQRGVNQSARVVFVHG